MLDDSISRQDAIDEAVAYIEEWNNAKSEYHKKEITRRFQNLPSTQPEPEQNTMPEQLKMNRFGVKMGKTCTDAISRQDAIGAVSRQALLDGLASIAKAKAKSDAQKALIGRTMFFAEQLPSVKPELETGKWIAIVAELGDHKIIVEGYNCSKCGRYDAEKDNFCPDCGARMSGGEQPCN